MVGYGMLVINLQLHHCPRESWVYTTNKLYLELAGKAHGKQPFKQSSLGVGSR